MFYSQKYKNKNLQQKIFGAYNIFFVILINIIKTTIQMSLLIKATSKGRKKAKENNNWTRICHQL